MTCPATVSAAAPAGAVAAPIAVRKASTVVRLLSMWSPLSKRVRTAEGSQRLDRLTDVGEGTQPAPGRLGLIALRIGDLHECTHAIELAADLVIGHRGVHVAGGRCSDAVERVPRPFLPGLLADGDARR